MNYYPSRFIKQFGMKAARGGSAGRHANLAEGKIGLAVQFVSNCHSSSRRDAWLPDGYSPIFRLYGFGPSGLKDYGSAPLRRKI